MTGFEFDRAPSPATNRSTTNDCKTCDGHRLVPLELDADEYYAKFGTEVWGRCPECNPAPTSERAPVEGDRWWTA